MLLGLLGVAFAQTHRVQFVELGTELPVVVRVTCDDVTLTSGLDGYLEMDVLCETIHVQSPYHYSASYAASEFINTTIFPLLPLEQQETVLIEEKRSPTHAQSYGLSTEDLERTPGGFDDPIRLIQSLPWSCRNQRVWSECRLRYFTWCSTNGKSFVY